jgi:hypothetical protein
VLLAVRWTGLFSFIDIANGREIRVRDVEISRVDFRQALNAGDVTKKGLFLLLIARSIDLANEVYGTRIKWPRGNTLSTKETNVCANWWFNHSSFSMVFPNYAAD